MVGVATSRGCAACRKQKKKCISDDSQPPCQRCKRLNIDCLELGQRRLKFQSENEKLSLLIGYENGAHNDKARVNASEKGYRFAEGIDLDTAQLKYAGSKEESTIHKPLGSALTRLQAGYIRIVDLKIDVAFQLPWNFGPYLEQVPRYLGRNKAFDAATEALIESYSCLRRSTWSGRDDRALAKYSKALKALRGSLSNPVEATSTETLAAISMLIIFESMAGFGPRSVMAHAGGAARVYKERGQMQPRNEFEALLQLSLRGVIIMQSLFLPSDYFTDTEWSALTQSQIGADSPEERAFRCFAVYSRLLHIAGPLLRQREASDNYFQQLGNLLKETQTLRSILIVELESLRQTFWYLTRILNKDNMHSTREAGRLCPDPSGPNTYHSHIGRSYGFAIANMVIINSMIQAINVRLDSHGRSPIDMEQWLLPDLAVENADLARECCHFARAVDYHRPLGTVYMAGVLRFVSVGASGNLSEPVKTLTSQSFKCPSQYHAGIISVLGGPEIPSEEMGIQNTMIFDNRAHFADDASVSAEIRMLLARFKSDFGESSSALESEMELNWVKKKFTFEDLEP